MSLARFYHWLFNVVLLLIALMSLLLPLQAEIDVFIFPEVKVNHLNSHQFSEKNIIPSVDIFVSGEVGPVLLLVEAFASESAQHIERLQLGINVTDSARAWLGRHHTPFGYWHTEFHHGSYLQTSISRPAMVELGGAGGITPSHTSGGLFETEIEQGESAWHYALSIGFTSQLDMSKGGHHGGDAATSLHDVDILNSQFDEHELATTLRVAYLPDALGVNQYGAFLTHADISLGPNISMGSEDSITLDIMGLFANYQQQYIRIISEWYYFSSALPEPLGFDSGHFSSAYVQFEFAVDEHWTPYVRFEDTFNKNEDPYLALLDDYSLSAQTAGIRFDFLGNHALKLEYANRHFNNDSTGRWQLSWSAVWP